jgi:hypothetical protein
MGGVAMKMRGFRFYIFWALVLFTSFRCPVCAQNYYINVYDGDPEADMSVYSKCIDLSAGEIIGSIQLSSTGTILNKRPFVATVGGRQYLIAFWQNGGYDKNSAMPLDHYVVGYAVLSRDDALNLVSKDSIVGATAEYVAQFPSENGFRFGLRSDRGDQQLLPEGIYGLNPRLGLVLRDRRDSASRPGIIRDLDDYEFLKPLSDHNGANLYTAYPYLLHIVKVNNEKDEILQVLHLPQSENQFSLFAYHPSADRIYLFHLNYEIHGKFDEYERGYEDNTAACHVIMFDADSFEMIDSLEIANYPQGDYPSPETGAAQVVGHFIVYYFFDSDWIGRFNPAMLFIFDTRTNEATWLRVGWR